VYSNLAILAAFAFLYSAIAGRLEKTPFNGAVIFVAFGIACGPAGLGVLDLSIDVEGIRLLAEFTLALVLFIDAANANLGVLRSSFQIPGRLLLIGLPLTILLGFVVGVLMFGQLSLLEIALLATILAPTDAALGKAVVTDRRVPSNIREGLNVESGLNDGICVPVLLVFLAFAAGSAHGSEPTALIFHEFASEIGIGAGVGVLCTVLGAFLMKTARARGWLGKIWMQLSVPAAAMTCFAAAQSLGGSGFIACFVGGLIGGLLMRKEKEELLHAAEATGDTFALLTWIVFGTAVVSYTFAEFSWSALVYSVLSLTVIRMLPAFLAFSGMGLSTADKLFLGWFGPRGLASIVFIVIVLGEGLPGGETLRTVVVWTILLSVIAHGLSANPLAARYGARGGDGRGEASDA
jgi:NhaP-type Na+/H+ or K+/H+ antiporter